LPGNNVQTPTPTQGDAPASGDTVPTSTGDAPASWAKDDVEKAISLNLIPTHMCNGYAANITRQEFCNVLSQVLRGKNLSPDEGAFDGKPSPFTDTDDADVVWLSALGVVNGVGNDAFNPAGLISRQEAAVMLKRAALALGAAEDAGASAGFGDQSQVASWAADSLGFVVAKGIMNGTGDNMFNPKGMYTRQQSYVTMLRLYNAAPDAAGAASDAG
jgi:hypothetical protein